MAHFAIKLPDVGEGVAEARTCRMACEKWATSCARTIFSLLS